MTLKEIRAKYPEAQNKTDAELEKYIQACEVLTELFFESMKTKFDKS